MGSGIEDWPGRQVAKVLPAGIPAVLRRVRPGGGVAAGDFLGEQDAEHLGRIPALGPGGGQHVGGGLPHVGQPHPAQQRLQLGRDRRGGRALTGSPVYRALAGEHRLAAVRALAAGAEPAGEQVAVFAPAGGLPLAAAGTLADRGDRGRPGHDVTCGPPRAAQLLVPGCAECASSAVTTSPGRSGRGEVVDYGGQVIVGEPAGDRRQPESMVDLCGADHGGELDCAGHLGADPLRPGCAASHQPPGRALAQRQERDLPGGPGPGAGLPRPVPGRAARVMLIADPRVTRRGQQVAGDLGQPAACPGHDDQLTAVHPAPHPVPGMAGRGGVPHRSRTGPSDHH